MDDSWNTCVVENWKDFVSLVDGSHPGKPWKAEFVYRGQDDAGWALRPTILRYTENVTAEALIEIERELQEVFAAQANLHLPSYMLRQRGDRPFDWWMVMRHFGAPTRLLDWTRSPYVAAYFAVQGSWNDEGTDGAIWQVNCPCLEQEADRRSGGAYEYSTFAKRCRDPDAEPIVRIRTMSPQFDRLVVQQGLCSCCTQVKMDHDIAIQTTLPNDAESMARRKVVIPLKQKPEFMRRLIVMNITANSLFPGADGLGRFIDQLAKVELQRQTATP